MRIGAMGVIGSAALAMLIGGCGEQDGQGGSATRDDVGSASDVRAANDDAREARVAPSLPSARSLGIRGWQETTWVGRGERTQLGGGALSQSLGALKGLAESRPELSVIPDEHGRHHLVGLVEPGDVEAILGVFASADVYADKMSSVPPTREILSIGRMAAAAVQLVSVEPSAVALVGAGADPAVVGRLERAARAWPTDARVWRIIGLPPDVDESSSVSFEPDNDPDDNHDEVRHRRLQAMGILGFAPVAGGGLGDLITASVIFKFQNQEQMDRELSVKFLYDRGTDQWVLRSIASIPSQATGLRLLKAGELSEFGSITHSLDVLSVLPDCHVITGPDGPLLCK